MIVKTGQIFFKRGYELLPITTEQVYELELNSQVYVKKNGIAYPYKITACYENAKKFKVEAI